VVVALFCGEALTQCSLCGAKALCPGSVSGCCVDVSVWPHAAVAPGCRSASGVTLRRGFATGRALCGFIAWFVRVLRGFSHWRSSSVDIERSVADSSTLSLLVLCCCPVPCALALSRACALLPLASTSTFITTQREESQTPVSVSVSHRVLLPLSLTPSRR